MNRNTESRFAMNPTNIDISRSRFDRSSSIKLSFNAGDIIPFYVDEVLPGDTFSIDTSKVVRMPSLLTPVMDNIYLDTYYFFVPNRLTWSHWKQFNGENTESAWIPQTEYEVPQVTSPPETGWQIGTIADYMGIPTGVPGLSVNAMPFRAYALIMNEWFRDENLTDPLNIPIDDATVQGSNGGNYLTDVVKGGLPFKAAKYHDYFTSCLPSPQKGPDVTISVVNPGPIPVYPRSDGIPGIGAPGSTPSDYAFARYVVQNSDGTPFTESVRTLYASGAVTGGPVNWQTTATPTDPSSIFSPSNLWAELDTSLPVATVNQLRMAFQVQKLYEKDARGGTRYIEILKSHFGVTSPDARLQRPEYLGGNRLPINVNQVLQSSETTSTSPQGTPTGQSMTVDVHSDFTKSFVEHGFVIGLMVARYDHTYQQGLERFWSRKDRFMYYWPVFANIGEQAVLNQEIYAQGTDVDQEIFGYQEAWADYRYKPSRVAGEMRSQYAQSLDVWHLADYYSQLPKLSDAWIREDKATIDRVIAVTSAVSHQFFADLFIRNRTTRPMPMYSIPGLIDHH